MAQKLFRTINFIVEMMGNGPEMPKHSQEMKNDTE